MKTLRDYRARIKHLIHTPGYGYMFSAAGFLLLSTVVWSLVAARLQQGNADQLADGFLFTDAATFRQAQFPAAHTQLLKWPLFWVLGLVHDAPWAYVAETTILSLVTVGGLAYLLFRIVHRPAVLGTLYLSLACVLVLVPVQVLGNVSSPLSLAMVTGRNVEYLVYITALVLVASNKKKDWRRWGLATALLGVLFASDQLFLTLSAGGAAALLVYAYGWRRSWTSLGWLWLAVSGSGWVLSRLLLWTAGRFTAVAGSSTGVSGVTNPAEVHSAIAYGLKGLLLNFGISVDAGWPALLPALLNLFLLGLVVYAAYMVGRQMSQPSVRPDRAAVLSLLLGLSALAAFLVYILTNHPAMADARYLTIALFAGFVALATYARTVRWDSKLLYGLGGVLVVGVLFGLVAVVRHTDHAVASDPIRVRNERVAQALAAHHEQILVGDFWRVLPIKEDTKRASQQILPLIGCLQPRQVLASGLWRQKSLYTHSFAYLLPLQSYGAAFGRCSLQTAVLMYGRPTSVVRIAGSQHNPTELLLLYNDGAARIRGSDTRPPIPVFGVPTEGTARPTGSTMVPLADPS